MCEKSNKIEKSSKFHQFLARRLFFWLPTVLGLVAVIWFLIRVLPKPSRASYPCQRAAFPVATGFILWITGFLGAGAAWAKARRFFARSKYVSALTCLALAAVLALQWWQSMPERATYAAGFDASVLNARHPVGTARGIFPGRVTWVYDAAATSWDGVEQSFVSNPDIHYAGDKKSWWGTSTTEGGDIVTSFTSQTEVNSMVSKNLQWLTGTTSDSAAWNAIFQYFNKNHGKETGGYQTGEKIFIKTNWVTTGVNINASTGVFDQDRRYFATSPEVVIALLTELRDAANVNLSNVTMGDTVRDWPQHVYDKIHAAFPNDAINFIGVDNLKVSGSTTYYQTRSPASADPLCFSNNPTATPLDRIPNCFENADYVINLAQMKTHARNGVTLCAKNYFGAMGRNPNAGGYYNTHSAVLSNSDGGSDTYGSYRVLTDLSGHPKIGGNVLLWMVDALYTGYDWAWVAPPQVWYSAPFNASTYKWPSSILMSLDPVAIDSVCLDFWKVEKYAADSAGHPLPGLSINANPTRPGVEDYLVEMALANNPPSGTVYKPDGIHQLSSLGTFETLAPTSANFATVAASRKYSRNLGTAAPGTGIELINAVPSSVYGRYVFYNNSAWDGNDKSATASDDNALATDKTALLPGGTASFVNYTSYDKGLNGVMLDVYGTTGSAPASTDFQCTMGNTSTPASWTAAPAPNVYIRRGAGFNGSDRITLIWSDKIIVGKWLCVHMIANSSKNLPSDTFYFGNAPGDTCNSVTDANVDYSDETACRSDPHNLVTSPALIANTQDFNRDRKVDTSDELIARNNKTTTTNPALQLFTAP